ncbi:MAG TPA: hydroxyethylthiazole kinase [Pseudolabrys sp.]|nr:hydroxyethylthiazole kinase [Pseudolabrys sp.]
MHASESSGPVSLPRIAADVLTRLRARAPRVHCITNGVAQNFTANVLLAAGAVPSMTISPEEIGEFVKSADALLVNLGTFDRERREAVEIAVASAAQAGKRWVLDPVFIDRAGGRAEFARALMKQSPAALRLNHAEFSVLSGTGDNREALMDYARAQSVVVALSGKTDLVADALRIATISNGHSLMARVTAMGCAASALVGACLAVEDDAWHACAAALLILGVAGEVAAGNAKGPGSFAAEILDAIFSLDGKAITQRAKVS